MKTSIRIATAVLTLLSAAGTAVAADIGISPANLTMRLGTGESGSTTVAGSVNNPPPTAYAVLMQLRPMGGSMPPAWISTLPATLTNRNQPLPLTLAVQVPTTAAAGTYTAYLQPTVMNSSIPLSPPQRPLVLSVTVTSKCAAAPAITVSAPATGELAPPNGRLENVGLSGVVRLPGGCTLTRLWYTLGDEYGVFSGSKDIDAGPDGSFAFVVPVQVSRRGDDKDGRLYQLTVYAADEAGISASAAASVVVRHDQRKEK